MALRVTQNMLSAQLMHNLNRNMLRTDDLQNQISTGRRINKPSDDPVGITYSLRYRSELRANEQFQSNVDSASSWLEFSDTMMNQAIDVFHRVRELTVKGSTGTNPQASLDAINSEIKELRGQLLDIANSKINGKYVFNGQQTDQAPYSLTDPAGDTTDTLKLLYEIGPGIKMPVTITGNEIFGEANGADNAFQILDDLSAALTLGSQPAIAASLDKIDTRFNKFLAVQADIGAKTNRVELMDARIKDQELNLTGLQSKTEDADYEELIIKSKINESVYQASLSVGAKVITPTLVDFLR